MAAPKKIKLAQAIIKSLKLETKVPLTTLSCTSNFDQITAADLNIKESIYNEDGIRRAGINEYGIDQDRFGDTLTFMPHQEALFGDNPLVIASVQVNLKKVLVQDSDGKMKLSFSIVCPGYPREIFDFIEAVKRGECSATIEKPDKAGEKDAMDKAVNFGLFALPKEPKPAKAATGNGAVVPPMKKPEEPENPPAENPVKEEASAEPATLASHASMQEPTLRGRGRKNTGK